MNQSILVTIQQAVNALKWKTPLQNQKALKLCASIFNLYRLNNQLYSTRLCLSSKYFSTIMGSKRDYVIKDKLVNAGILDCDNKYSVAKHIGKGYRFNPQFFANINVSSTNQTFTYSISKSSSKNSTIIYLFPHQEPSIYNGSNTQFLQNYVFTNMNKLSFTDAVDNYIDTASIVQIEDIKINEEITDDFVYLKFDKDEKNYRYSLKKALALAHTKKLDLIKYKSKFYLYDAANFATDKSIQLRIFNSQSVYNINNKRFYCDRNSTNHRLDYNLTGLKKELFDYLQFDGEKLVELDIANAQFAIAAHLNTTIDANFVFHAQRGSLYSSMETELNLKPKEGKALMFRVAFDKIKHENEFNQIRSIFPLYMKWADSYKKQNGYKAFANLLQKKEAEIMIDGLLMHLIEKGYEVFTIHDALRVKESQATEIKAIVDAYFASIGFECLVRGK